MRDYYCFIALGSSAPSWLPIWSGLLICFCENASILRMHLNPTLHFHLIAYPTTLFSVLDSKPLASMHVPAGHTLISPLVSSSLSVLRWSIFFVRFLLPRFESVSHLLTVLWFHLLTVLGTMLFCLILYLLAWNALCKPSWLWTHRNLQASASAWSFFVGLRRQSFILFHTQARLELII